MAKQNNTPLHNLNTRLVLGCLIFCMAPIAWAAESSDVAKQPTSWAYRNDPEAVSAFAQEFLTMLVLDDLGMNINKFRSRPGLMETAKLAKEKKYAEALSAFQKYFMNKLRYPSQAGLSAWDVNPTIGGVCGQGMWPSAVLSPTADQAKTLEAADKLMQGLVMLDGKEVKVGAPGTVNWNYPFAKDAKIQFTNAPANGLFLASAFTPLAQAYVITRRDDYLKRWCEYLDDWAIHSNYADSIHPCQVPDGGNSSSGGGFISFTRLMAALAALTPEGKEIIPAVTFARVVRKYMSEYLLLPMAYIRSNTHNWTPSAGLLLMAMFYDEFKIAPDLFREGLRRNIEDNVVTQNLRDGTENQQCPWYNSNYLDVYAALRLLDARKGLQSYRELPWISDLKESVEWKNEIRTHLGEHLNYFIRIRTPQGEYPIPIRGGDKRSATGIPAGEYYDMSPETYNNPINKQIYSAMTNPGAGVRPEGYDSDWFPYGGYNVVREGWEKESGYGALFCSPQPGAYGGFRSRSNNNSFGLAAFGQDLLVDDSIGHYMYPGSPILVDGKNQFFHAGIYKVEDPARHKVYQVSAWTTPSPWRWHASGQFNLMEGIYAGPYSAPDVKSAVAGKYGLDESSESSKKDDNLQRDVKHQRLVHYVREAKLWIITDRMLTEKEHQYEQVWRLAMKPCAIPAFNEADIKVDAVTKTISTRSKAATEGSKEPGAKADLTLVQFCSQPLTYKTKTVIKDPKNHYQSSSRMDVSATWKGVGNQQVVTVAYPRKVTGGVDLKAIKPLALPAGVTGFEAQTPEGVSVLFASATAPAAEITLGSVRVNGESLLLCGNKGVALGCRQMTVNGKAVSIPSADFEFTFASERSQLPVSFAQIYQPIDPVKVLPERNVFMGEVDVALTSGTKDVEIRYTVDGTEPNMHSLLYKGPFKLTCSAVVKAKAYRPGLTTDPDYMSGTLSSPVSFGVFNKEEPIESVKVLKPKTGILCNYYEADWKRMWLFLDTLQPVASGETKTIWDLSLIPASNGPVGDKPAPRQKFFALEYKGFLDIPEDGVYTFHAPREYTMPDTDAGYELNVYLGNHSVPFGYRTQIIGLNQWYPATRLHAFGNWSIALRKGLQPFRLTYVDYRTDTPSKLNKPGLRDYIWSGVTPELKISGPGIAAQPIPAAWLLH